MTEIFSNPLQTKTMLNRLMDCGSGAAMTRWQGVKVETIYYFTIFNCIYCANTLKIYISIIY